jgi:UDP-N-acetyl-D-mannosaminuronic acid dehydrogenase
MVEYVIELLRDELGSLDGRKIAILGVAYKGNVGDTRMSPGLELARTLQQGSEQAAVADGGTIPTEISIHDPNVTDSTLALEPFDQAIQDADAAVIVTDHDEFETIQPSSLIDAMREPFVLDTKAILDTDEWKDTDAVLRRI